MLVERVLPRLEAAAEDVELLRLGASASEQRQWLLTGKEELYREGVLCCQLAGRGEQGLGFSERARARAFLDTIGSARIERLRTPTGWASAAPR